jgi:hypothetical protein
MATQWTAGLTDGVPLPAATLNTIGAAWETWTPTVTQSVNVTINASSFAKYARINKTVFISVYLLISGTGTGANAVRMSLPIASKDASGQLIGSGFIFDASATNLYLVTSPTTSTTSIGFYANQSGTGAEFGVVPNIGLAVNDQIRVVGFYEAA